MKSFSRSDRSTVKSLWVQGCLKILSPLALATLAILSSGRLVPSTTAWAETNIPQAIATLKEGGDRWIEVDLSQQRLMAWEGGERVYAVIISGGTEFDPTLPGSFTIQSKHETARMQGDDYDVPDVPFTMYYDGSYAIHGAYWHQEFGTPVSHGCINVAVDHAEWFFSWASVGTPVIVHY